jgi:hypothetical protein
VYAFARLAPRVVSVFGVLGAAAARRVSSAGRGPAATRASGAGREGRRFRCQRHTDSATATSDSAAASLTAARLKT